MASVYNSTPTLIHTPFTSSTIKSSTPKPSQLFPHGKSSHGFKVSCKVSNNDQNKNDVETSSVDRRNVLLGLGGMYGVANVAPLASAAPFPIPFPPSLPLPMTSCGAAQIVTDGEYVPYGCCPPKLDMDPKDVPYYKLPTVSKLRIRPAAHMLDEEYMAKYNLAITKMKELNDKDPNDPRGFKQQANIHCAYCNDAYIISGEKFQVHFSWLFFPFHRWYVYFYEKILGSLINDPTFGLPYWNFDHPKGMRLPPVFDQPEKYPALFDQIRNPKHRGSTILDLGYSGDQKDATANDLQTISNNLTLMYRQMITNAPCAQLFFGKAYSVGSNPSPGMGTIENIPHNAIHQWVGTEYDTTLPTGRKSYGEDMGNFYSSGLDPAFYCLHSNVDRLWIIWKTLGGKRKDIDKEDYLNTEFFFYDENKNPVRVKVSDCLDPKAMGYDYKPMPTPWLNYKPLKKGKVKIDTSSLPPPNQVFPISKLDKPISFCIRRPHSGPDKDDKEEILTFKKIKYDERNNIRFDVFINADLNSDWNELDNAEFAGSYTNLPHFHGDARKPPDDLEFPLAINELLEDLDLVEEEIIGVTLVPKFGGEFVSIDSAVITLEDC